MSLSVLNELCYMALNVGNWLLLFSSWLSVPFAILIISVCIKNSLLDQLAACHIQADISKFNLYLSLHVYQTNPHKDESLHKPNSRLLGHISSPTANHIASNHIASRPRSNSQWIKKYKVSKTKLCVHVLWTVMHLLLFFTICQQNR